MPEPQLRPLGFGEILDGAFTLYRHHFPTFFTTALIAFIPLTLMSGAIQNASLAIEGGTEASAGALGMIFLAFPVMMLLWALVWSALTRQTAETYGGRGTSLRDGFASAVKALPRLIGAGALIFLIAIALAIAFGILSAIAAIAVASWIDSRVMQWISAAVFIGLFVGMFVLAAMLFAVIPAVVVEGLGPWSAIRRSQQLSRGARIRIIGVVLVSSLIVVLPTLGLGMVLGLGASLLDPASAVTLSPVQLFAQQLLSVVSGALTAPFMVGCMTLLYFDRRVRTEGYDLEVAADSLAVPA